MSIGSRIKELRENKGLSRNELAAKIGVTVGAVSNYENDVSSPKEPILFKIIEELDCDANYLFQDMVNVKKGNDNFTYEECDLIKKYRRLDEHGRKTVEMILDNELERCPHPVMQGQLALADDGNIVLASKLQQYHERMNLLGARNDSIGEDGELEKTKSDIKNLKRPN